MYKEERNAIGEDMRKIYGYGTEKLEVLETLDSSEATIAILGDRLWPQTGKEEQR